MSLTEDKVPKVLLVGPSLGGGGAEKRFANLSARLFKGQADVCVLQDNGNSSENRIDGKIGSLNWKGDYSYPRMVLTLRRKIKSGKYDVVMGLGPYPNFLVWAATRFYVRRPKILLTEISRPWTVWQYRRNWLMRSVGRIISWLAYSQADLMAANSLDGINECVKYFGVSSDNIVRLPNLINPDEINFKAGLGLRVNWPSHYQVIAIAARLDRMKRVDVLLEAVALLPEGLEWFVVIVGDGPELNNLRRQAEELKVSHRVEFLGWTDNPLPILKRATVCVLCSEFEGFSNWVLEAMFLRVPVVTSFCSSDARAMCSGGAALGFEPGDTRSLSKHLANVLNHSNTRDGLTKAAWEYCSSHEISRAIPAYERAIMRTAANGHL